jgi:hypothetical protein
MSKPTVQVPVSLIEENLTLSEIGAIIVLLASPKASWCCKSLWDSDRSFSKTIESLRHQGIIKFDEEGHIVIDLKNSESSEESHKSDDVIEQEPQTK